MWAELETVVSLKKDSEFVLNNSALLWSSSHCTSVLYIGVERVKK